MLCRPFPLFRLVRFLTVGALVALAAPVSAPASAQTWQAAPAMSTPRTGAAWAVLDGRLYVMGGRSAGGDLLRSAEVFTPGMGWAPIRDLRDARAGARAVVLGGAIHLIGGRDRDGPSDNVDVYRPARDDWESSNDLGAERDGLAAGTARGRLFVLGGATDGGALLGSAETFESGNWEPYPTWALAPARALAGSAEAGGAVVVAGGFSQFGPLAAVQRFVPGAGPVTLPALPAARGGLALASDGAALFAVGGRDATDARLASVDRLGAGAQAWVALPSLPEAREGAAAAVVGLDLYVAGGTGPFGTVLASVVRLGGVVVGVDDGPAGRSPVALDGPNPARGAVRLRFEAPEAGPVRLTVVDVRGREVAVLADGSAAAGLHRVRWDAAGRAPGIYAARLTTSAGASVVRFALVR